MKKTKIILGLLVVGVLAISGIALAATDSQTGQRVYALTDNSVIKTMLGVNHEFPGAFSTQASSRVKVLEKLGLIKTEPVQIYEITGRPVCDYDGTCEEGENPSCLDCKNSEEEPTAPPERCTPEGQTPWGIIKVNGGSGGADIKVAVLDTGVYKDHLDLTERMAICMDFTRYPRVANNACNDGNGHGTHVAGTILADGGIDGLGILGVAPEAKLMAYKVLKDNGRGYSDDIAAAIDQAVSDGANIISMSLGGALPDSIMKSAIDGAVNSGVLVIAAAGNSGPASNSIIYPAAYAEVVAIAAFNSLDRIADFSSRGMNDGDWTVQEREIEFAAPGVAVESTWNNGCYYSISGTSMATPHIAGIAARDWQGTAVDTRAYLQDLAKYYTNNTLDYGQTGDDIEAGFGLPIN